MMTQPFPTDTETHLMSCSNFVVPTVTNAAFFSFLLDVDVVVFAFGVLALSTDPRFVFSFTSTLGAFVFVALVPMAARHVTSLGLDWIG